jgi:hypothetical protein
MTFSVGSGPMSLDDQGFLSKDLADFQNHIRDRYMKYFDVIHRMNSFCQQAKYRLSINNLDGREIIAVQCPPIVYTDLNGLFCKVLEEAHLSS